MAGQSAVKPTSSNHFEALYEAPFGGVSTEAYATDIDSHQFVSATGLCIRQGVLCSEYWDGSNSVLNWTSIPSTSIILAVCTVGNTICVFDNSGNVFINSTGVGFFILDQTSSSIPQGIDCFQIINGTVYLFDYNGGQSFIYVPTVSYSLNNYYVGGKYCCVCDGYLLTANTNQPTDNPAVKQARVNWSAPYQFGVWDPSISRNAGYNVLADIQDTITGIFSIANVAFVIRTNGITQLTPTGIAIQPFDFPTMLGGDFGIGCTFPQTLVVYSAFAIFGDYSDFYIFSGGMPDAICGAAREAIFADINSPYTATGNNQQILVSAAMANASYNNLTPDLCYRICIAQVLPGSTRGVELQYVFWTYNLKRKTWMRTVVNITTFLLSFYGQTYLASASILQHFNRIISLKYPAVSSTPTPSSPVFNYPVVVFTGPVLFGPGGIIPENVNYVLNLFQNLDGTKTLPTVLNVGTPAFSLVFRQEEVKLGRQPTIIRVVLRAAGYGTINVQVGTPGNGNTWTPIQLSTDPTIPEPFQTYTSSGNYTGETPQLTLSSTNFYGTINKVMMTGTYADGDYD